MTALGVRDWGGLGAERRAGKGERRTTVGGLTGCVALWGECVTAGFLWTLKEDC